MSDDSLVSPLRSALFVPGDKPRAVEKTPGLGADVLILDLEDAVAPERKDAARAAAPGSIRVMRASRALCAVRIGAPDADGFHEDVNAAAAARPDIVLAAKIEGADALAGVRAALVKAGWSGPLWAMIETPSGVAGADALALAGSSLGLEALIAGTNDLAEGLRLPAGPERRRALEPHLARIVLAARAGGLRVLDGVYNAYQDAGGFQLEAQAGRAMGFDGKTLIHPSQVDAANAAFTPGETETVWAQRVVGAFADPANAGKGALALDGRMIERLHLDAARAVLAAAGQKKEE